ncbi:MAG: metal ABC transporter substrate-binding protein [Actinomycetota bacterium]
MATWSTLRRYAAVLAALALVLAACGSDDGDSESSDAGAAASGDVPTVVVTTNILGDVVNELVSDQANVVTIMPVGADPHDFQPSAQEVDQILGADALIVNGTSFEEGLLDVIESAEEAGIPTFEATSAVQTIEFSGDGHDDHGHDDDHGDEEHSDEEGHDHEDEDDHDHDDEDKEHSDEEGHDHDDEEGHDHEDEEGHDDEDKEHSDEEGHDHDDEEGHDHEDEEGHDDEDKEHSDEEGHDHDDEEGHDDHGHAHDGDDPHFFTDPDRMADAVEGIGDFLTAEVDGIDAAALDSAVDAYVGELEALDAEVEALVAAIPEEQRVLITNHEVFGYFADRYGFEVVGAVIPSGSTLDGASAGDLAELAELIEDEGVPAIFSDTSSSDALVETLAAEVGDVEVVELFSESLGDGDSEGATYLEMVRTNATRISAALA